MKKKLLIAILVTAFAAAQGVCTFAANSPDTKPTIHGGGSSGGGGGGGGSHPTSGGSQGSGTGPGSSGLSSTSQVQDTVHINVGDQTTLNGSLASTTVQTNERGQAVIGDTAVEFANGEAATAGLPAAVVDSINRINRGEALAASVPGVDLNGYEALIGTHAVVTKTVDTNQVKTGDVQVPIHVPNLLAGLNNLQVLFYDNATGTWRAITPSKIDFTNKTLWVNFSGSGTFTVMYKR